MRLGLCLTYEEFEQLNESTETNSRSAQNTVDIGANAEALQMKTVGFAFLSRSNQW